MKRGQVFTSTPIDAHVDAKIDTHIRIKNVRRVIEDIVSGNFNQEVMSVESKKIPIQTSERSVPSFIKIGVEFKGVNDNNVDEVTVEVSH